jgi:ABC-type dipeptide/oligopeptide/nickel transport system ATPase component
MNRHNFIGVTILVSVLALNPLVAIEFQNKIQTRLNHSEIVSNSIASILHKRGLDEDAAKEIADSFVDGDDELLVQMVNNLATVLSHEEVLEYLSTVALHRKEIRLDSYGHLVNMVSKIKRSSLDKKTLAHLNVIAKLNSQLIG